MADLRPVGGGGGAPGVHVEVVARDHLDIAELGAFVDVHAVPDRRCGGLALAAHHDHVSVGAEGVDHDGFAGLPEIPVAGAAVADGVPDRGPVVLGRGVLVRIHAADDMDAAVLGDHGDVAAMVSIRGIASVAENRRADTPAPAAKAGENTGRIVDRERFSVLIDAVRDVDVAAGHHADVAPGRLQPDVAEVPPGAVARARRSDGDAVVAARAVERAVAVRRIRGVATMAELHPDPSVFGVGRVVLRERAGDQGDVTAHLDIDVAVETERSACDTTARTVSSVTDLRIGILPVACLDEESDPVGVLRPANENVAEVVAVGVETTMTELHVAVEIILAVPAVTGDEMESPDLAERIARVDMVDDDVSRMGTLVGVATVAELGIIEIGCASLETDVARRVDQDVARVAGLVGSLVVGAVRIEASVTELHIGV